MGQFDRNILEGENPDKIVSTGTSGGNFKPFEGTLKIRFTDGITQYRAELFEPQAKSDEGLIYYRVYNEGMTPEAEAVWENVKELGKKSVMIGTVAAVATAGILLAPETGGTSVPAAIAIIGVTLTPPNEDPSVQ